MKLLYLCLTIAALLFSMLYLPVFSVYLLLTLLLIPIGLYIAAHFTGHKIKAAIQIETDSIYSKQPFACSIVLTNCTRFPIGTVKAVFRTTYAALAEKSETVLCTAVPAKGTAILKVSVTSDHCGKILLELCRIRCFDPIRLFSHRKSIGVTQTVYALPDIPNPPDAAELSAGQTDPQTRMISTSEPEEFLGIRTYRHGDRMRSIHWKLSSRLTDPVIREYGIPEQTTVAVCWLYALRPDRPCPGDRLDAMLEAVSALTAGICQSGNRMTLLVYGSVQYSRYTISTWDMLKPILHTILESPPESDPAACQNQLEKFGESISFCIADSVSHTVPNAQMLISDIAAVSRSFVSISPENAAETVYRLLAEFHSE